MKIAMVHAADPLVNSGGGMCSRNHILLMERLFGKENVQVYCLSQNPAQIEATSENWHGYLDMNTVQRFFSTLRMQKWMSVKTQEQIAHDINAFGPDLLWVENSYLGKFIARGWSIPVIAFFQNIERCYTLNRVKHRGAHYLPVYLAACLNERLTAKCADYCVCLNGRDGDLLYKFYGRHPDLYLPISLDDQYDQTVAQKTVIDKTELLFVGSNFPPNADGIRWFIKNGMSKLPMCHLTIVGKGFEDLRSELERENVQVVGTAEDLASYYYRAAAMVMPILYGDGMKVKTAEAMIFGKKIFASPEALEGYDAEDLAGICRCDTAQDYIDNISAFFNDPDRQTFWPEVRQCFLSGFELHTQESKLKQLINGINGGA